MPNNELESFRNKLAAAWVARRNQEDAIRGHFEDTITKIESFLQLLVTAIQEATSEPLNATPEKIDYTKLPTVINYKCVFSQAEVRRHSVASFNIAIKIELQGMFYDEQNFRRDDLTSLFASIMQKAAVHYQPKAVVQTSARGGGAPNIGWPV